MAKIVILCVVLFVVVAGQNSPTPRKVACTRDNEKTRDNFIEQAKCELRPVFVVFKVKAAHEQFSPRAVWVRRCVGLCDYDNLGTCVPVESAIRNVTLRISNEKTQKDTCAMYPIEEHFSCQCRELTNDDLAKSEYEVDDA